MTKAARLGLDALFAVAALALSARVGADLAAGGSAWRQGDWLINGTLVEVRRAFFGDGFIALHDLTGVPLLWLVCGAQLLLIALLCLVVHRLLRTLDPLLALSMALSCGFFAVLWVVGHEGALRKEMLGFVGLGLTALALLRGVAPLVVIGSGLLWLGFLGHEALVLMAPCHLMLLWLGRGQVAEGLLVALGLATCGAAALALFFAFRFSEVPEAALVCRPLLERGMQPQICEGAIQWLEKDRTQGAQAVRDLLNPLSAGGFALACLVALLPLVGVLTRSDHPRLGIALGLALGLPFLPLYPVALDWGRWVGMHVFCAVTALALALHLGHLRIIHPLRRWHKALWFAPLVIVPITNSIGARWGGVLRAAWDLLAKGAAI
ncbi:hypothetical protein [Mameliella sediminis]|uniref:hypothetical protein n=1 Tax=Mameliella sediminis TaxID=2836866 RepID=UPI001C45FD7B|nr:hypothetical protein [Mameliella sediminis]MBV7396101.1 hypothetical protein [Mameliella sediminis]